MCPVSGEIVFLRITKKSTKPLPEIICLIEQNLQVGDILRLLPRLCCHFFYMDTEHLFSKKASGHSSAVELLVQLQRPMVRVTQTKEPLWTSYDIPSFSWLVDKYTKRLPKLFLHNGDMSNINPKLGKKIESNVTRCICIQVSL